MRSSQQAGHQASIMTAKLTIIKLSQSIKEWKGCLVVVKLLNFREFCTIKENIDHIRGHHYEVIHIDKRIQLQEINSPP
jgi:hypothetical protein